MRPASIARVHLCAFQLPILPARLFACSYQRELPAARFPCHQE